MLKRFMFLSLIALGSQISAEPILKNQRKIRVEKKSIRILKEGFSIITENGTFLTKSIRSDKIGLYVLQKDTNLTELRDKKQRHATRSRTYWVRCPACHKWCKNRRQMMNHTCDSSSDFTSTRPGLDSSEW